VCLFGLFQWNVDGVFKHLARLEGEDATCSDGDRVTGLRIASAAVCFCLTTKLPNPAILIFSPDSSVFFRILKTDSTIRMILSWKSRSSGEFFDDVCLGHNNLYVHDYLLKTKGKTYNTGNPISQQVLSYRYFSYSPGQQ